jgi:hypothetical protein
MHLIAPLASYAGWTSFSGVFSTVFPLVILIVVLTLYTVGVMRRRSG